VCSHPAEVSGNLLLEWLDGSSNIIVILDRRFAR